MIRFFYIMVFCGVAIAGCRSGGEHPFLGKAEQGLAKLVALHSEFSDVHPLLKDLHPVAVTQKDSMHLFDYDSLKHKYVYLRKEAVPFSLPPQIRAAFPLSTYKNRSTCFVTIDVFDSLKGFATLFHEFVHCGQSQQIEYELKAGLQVAREATQAQNYAWEINHPFPYEDSLAVNSHQDFLRALEKGDAAEVSAARKFLANHLSRQDYEYMVWQEWKEGMARLLENRFRKKYDMPLNRYGSEPPMNRISFYYSGEMYIKYLTGKDERFFVELEALFTEMMKLGS